jgi:hypothetical protein
VAIHRTWRWLGFGPRCDPTPDDQVQDLIIMRVLEAEVFDAVWMTIETMIPPPPRTQLLGCHRPRVEPAR